MISLIERFYDPESGSIILGPLETPLKNVDTDWFHSNVALVSQEPVLFGSIYLHSVFSMY